MTKVEVNSGNFEKALRKFQTDVARSGVPSEIRKRKHYDKPGVRKRLAKKEGIKNTAKAKRRRY